MNEDIYKVGYVLNGTEDIVTITHYDGETSLTNLMPALAKHWNGLFLTKIKYIEYVDSDGQPTLYNVAMDSYSALPNN